MSRPPKPRIPSSRTLPINDLDEDWDDDFTDASEEDPRSRLKTRHDRRRDRYHRQRGDD